MDICILSMQKVNNFGSLLQSYALKKMLTEKQNKVAFIDIKKIPKDDVLIKERTIFNREEDGRIKSNHLLNKISKIDMYALNRIKIKKQSNIQENLFEDFRKNILQINMSDNDKRYDLCVIGSDEVFNCLSRAKWGFTSQLFGNVEQADNIITYAASCGATKYENVPETVIEVIKKSFERISGFSARDNNTKEFTQSLTKKEIHNHLDPVLVGDFTEEMACAKPIEGLSKKYCIVYSYYNRIHKPEEINAIKQFCKKKKLEIVAIGAPQKWIKNYPVLDPFQMLVAFKNADFIITDTFHGTIFSAKYNGKFATLIRDSNRNKLMDLIDRIGVQDHLVCDFSELDKAWNAPNSVQSVGEVIKTEREKTLSYLDEALEKIKQSRG